MKIELREVQETDLPDFFDHQQDPVAGRMAAFTAKDPADQAAFTARWAKILGDESITKQTILVDGQVAGSVMCHGWFGDPEVCYWLGREFWGRGVATQALSLLLSIVPLRPLVARAAADNVASLRVLQKCGFTITGNEREFSNARGGEVDEVVLTLSG
ncbi:MAG: family N-acetyltransferase [Armatimonadetes bacterium]|nr:family N-acetyltransferase [Armatimonadota bacterium]